jgi:PAS domain S-box-containing protein
LAREQLARIAQSTEGEGSEFEYRVRHRDGRWRWLLSRSLPFARNDQGGVRQIVTATFDITDRSGRARVGASVGCFTKA